VLFEATEASAFKKAGIDKAKLERRPVKRELDDDVPDGKKSIAGGGHARRFRAPGAGEWYLTAVSVHGGRYGAANPPASATFDVALCDETMRPVAAWKHPYRLFGRGDSKWVRIEIPPTRVPPGAEGFYVALDFRPTATQGVYVSFDASTKGGEEAGSRVATPGKAGQPFAAGDWMVRVELDRPQSSDALKE
jgi:RNA polymerase sigma-70 factor (ECF subfamily)